MRYSAREFKCQGKPSNKRSASKNGWKKKKGRGPYAEDERAIGKKKKSFRRTGVVTQNFAGQEGDNLSKRGRSEGRRKKSEKKKRTSRIAARKNRFRKAPNERGRGPPQLANPIRERKGRLPGVIERGCQRHRKGTPVWQKKKVQKRRQKETEHSSDALRGKKGKTRSPGGSFPKWAPRKKRRKKSPAPAKSSGRERALTPTIKVGGGGKKNHFDDRQKKAPHMGKLPAAKGELLDRR